MTTKLQQALAAYRAALLETAVGDLMWRQHGHLKSLDATSKVRDARDDVLDASVKLTAEQFTAALMESGFLQEPKA